jgi:hypothetical protein
MKRTLDYRSPPAPAKRTRPSAKIGTTLLVLNGVGFGISILLLVASNSVGSNPRAPTSDALTKGFFFLIECAFLAIQVPLGISSIIYACFLPRSERRLWIFVAAISAMLLGLVLLFAGLA